MKKIKIIILTVIIVTLSLLLTGCQDKKEITANSNNDKVQNEYKNKKEDEILQNIELKDFILEDDTLLVVLKNKNNFDVKTLWIEVIFYDNENKVVGTSKTGFKVLKSNTESAINDFDVPSRFNSYKIELSLGENNSYETYTDKIKIDSNNTGEKIVVIAENNSGKNLNDLSISIVFYREGIPVGFSEETQYDIEKDKISYFNILYPYNDFERVDFDEYKIFVNSAYDQY